MSKSILSPRNPFEGILGWDACLRLFRPPFWRKTGFGRILALANTSGCPASETAPVRTSCASYGTPVREHSLLGSMKLLTLHYVSCDSRSYHSLSGPRFLSNEGFESRTLYLRLEIHLKGFSVGMRVGGYFELFFR